ncbi:MAG TPA: aldo/keto reductase [Anaerolineales bacterium]|nr:aldo/keto reductase [Anaerolineales bacterium]
MNYRPLGCTGVRVSPLCLGTFNFGSATPESDAIRIIHKAIGAGINFIDTADYYTNGESERIVGKALKGRARAGVLIATKVHYPMPGDPDPNGWGNSRYHVLNAVEASLRRLNTDHIDLYQLHRPDFSIPQEETLRALDDLVTQGKVRYTGSSTFPAWMVMEALGISERRGWVRFVTEQPPYNLLDRRIENELVPLALKYGIGLLPWSPLAIGMLTGRYTDAARFPADSRAGRIGAIYADRITERAVKKGNALLPLAHQRGLTPSQLALLWCKDQPAVTAPIIGPRTEAHLDDALPLLEMSLDLETAVALDESFPPGTAFADFHNSSGWMKMKVSV